MENRRIRNFSIYTEQNTELEALLGTKCDKVNYTQDHYYLHFKVPISTKALRKWSGCQNVQSQCKRKPRTMPTAKKAKSFTPVVSVPSGEKSNESAIQCKLNLNDIFGDEKTGMQDRIRRAQKNYEKRVELGESIEAFIKTECIPEDALGLSLIHI